MKNLFLIFIFSLVCFACSKKNTSYLLSIKNAREIKHQSLIEGDNAPLLKGELSLLQYFEINENYRCACEIEVFDKNAVIEMPTYAGTTTTYQLFGKARCIINKQPCDMVLYRPVQLSILYKGRLFLPFKDLTNGESTYGGGRYIDLLEKDIVDGKITIDFNKAYNPLCAYKDGFRCPIPPKENHLTVAITAGEKIFGK